MDERTKIFADWMRDHLGILHRISRAYAESADQHDLMQELMLAVWKSALAFRGGSAPSTFIYRVALNRALTWRRTESGRVRRASVAEEWHAAVEQAADPDQAALLDQLYAAIRRLRPVDRGLILLALDGVPHREIARLHDFSETNVGVRLSRARQDISRFVQEQDNGL